MLKVLQKIAGLFWMSKSRKREIFAECGLLGNSADLVVLDDVDDKLKIRKSKYKFALMKVGDVKEGSGLMAASARGYARKHGVKFDIVYCNKNEYLIERIA